MRSYLSRSIPLVTYLVLAGALLPLSGDERKVHLTELDGGYFLLHRLASDESQVPMLMVVKHAPAEIGKFADEMGKVGKKTLEALDRIHDHDPALQFDQNPLPAIEQDVRDSIKADKQHQLLFGTKDSEFVRNFLVSQIEASTYALHVSKVLGEKETDPARARTLQQLSNDWGIARAQAYRLLRNY